MGYSTHYNLTWERQKNWKPIPNCEHGPTGKFCAERGATAGFKDLGDIVATYINSHDEMSYVMSGDGSSQDSGKWYEHEKDMVAMSSAFPGVLFKLHGEGEENDDIWDAYFLNGKMQKHKAKVMIDDVDPKAWK